jgi:hypothetical protein
MQSIKKFFLFKESIVAYSVFPLLNISLWCILLLYSHIRPWSDRKWVKWSDWSEVSYGEVLVNKGAMYIRVTLYCGHLLILRLFHVGISCTAFVLICTVVVLYCFVMCVCVCVCVFVVICILYSDWGFSWPDWGFSYPDWGFFALFPQL